MPDHRRKWDTEEYEKLVAARLEEEEKKALERELSKSDPPVRREMLKPRDYKVYCHLFSLGCSNIVRFLFVIHSCILGVKLDTRHTERSREPSKSLNRILNLVLVLKSLTGFKE